MCKRAFLTGLFFTMFMASTTVFGYEYTDESPQDYFDVGVSVEFLAEAPPTTDVPHVVDRPTTYMTTAPLNLRPSPSTNGERILLVQPGRQVEIIDFRDGEWFQVNYNGQRGYMYASYLREMPAHGQHVVPGTVELLQWSEARNILPQNVPFTAIDTRTGISFQLISFSHGSHADVFPATAEDTEIMRQLFGGWSWATRPIVIALGDRTLAASINGMPHGGAVSRGNNMNGHICIHFQGSRTHNGSRNHENDHQRSVLEAFNTASNWS